MDSLWDRPAPVAPLHLAREMSPMIWFRKSYIQTGAKMPRFTQSGSSTVGFLWIADLDSIMIEWHEGHSVSPLAQASSHVVQDAQYRSDTFSVCRIWHTPKWFTLRCPVSKKSDVISFILSSKPLEKKKHFTKKTIARFFISFVYEKNLVLWIYPLTQKSNPYHQDDI